MAELYRLEFSSGKSYIGMTMHSARERLSQHTRAAKSSGKGSIYDAWRGHGVPRFELLAIVDDADRHATEIRAIAVYATRYPLGYNMTDGGDASPALSREVAQKIAGSLTGKTIPPSIRAKISAAHKGVKHSAVAIEKMKAAKKGTQITAAARMKMAIAKIGSRASNITRSRMAASQRARRLREGCKVK